MKGKGWAEGARGIDVAKTTKFVNENLEKLVLHLLRRQAGLSKHEIIQWIFNRQGVSVNPSRMDTLLEVLKGQGLIEETKRELITAYALTDKGKEIAERVRINELKTLL